VHKRGIRRSPNDTLKNKPTIHFPIGRACALQQLRVIVWLRKLATQWKGPKANATPPIAAWPTQTMSLNKQQHGAYTNKSWQCSSYIINNKEDAQVDSKQTDAY